MLPGFGFNFSPLNAAIIQQHQQQQIQQQLQQQHMQNMQNMININALQRGAALAAAPSPILNVPLPNGRPPAMLVPKGMAAEDNEGSPQPGGSGQNQNPQQPAANPAPAENPWSEHRTSDNRIFYYNRITKVSVWSKPDELRTPEERQTPPAPAAVAAVWKEYKTADNRTYYYNTVTKLTTWNKPDGMDEPHHAEEAAAAVAVPVVEKKEEPKEESEMDKAMKATLASITPAQAPTARKEPEMNMEFMHEDNEQDLKKRQAERFRELLRDKYNEGKIASNSNWEHAVKHIQNDARFRILSKVSEKKQLFNAWRVQRQKEERDEKRLAIKKAKEDLEKWLQDHSKMKPSLKYSKAKEIFAKDDIWKAVQDEDRVEIFRDVLEFVTKRDEERDRVMRKRNVKTLDEILISMDKITYKTTWVQAQRLLIENPQFADDTTLQSMDKEDALVVFTQRIDMLEKEHDKDKQFEEGRIRRQERKVREAFQRFLSELHKKGELTSMSLWSSLYPTICCDTRFDAMLTQSGSTPLDMFKFFVEELKEQFGQDRRIIKDILADLKKVVRVDTSYDEFTEWVRSVEQGTLVDHGNMKLCYNSLIEKAEQKEKEAEREEQRRKRRLESEFKQLLKAAQPVIESTTEWTTIRPKIEKEKGFTAIESEEMRIKYFDDFKQTLADSCSHHHTALKKKKKEKKKKRDSESEGEIKEGRDRDREKERKKRKKHRDDSDEERDKERSRKKKRKRSRTRSYSRSGDERKRAGTDSDSD